MDHGQKSGKAGTGQKDRGGENRDLCPDFAGDLEKDLIYKQILNRLENQNPDVRMLVNAAGFGKIGEAKRLPGTIRRPSFG